MKAERLVRRKRRVELIVLGFTFGDRVVKVRRFVVVVGLAVLCGSAPAGETEWVEHTSEKDGYLIEFPGTAAPLEEEQAQEASGTSFTTRTSTVARDMRQFVVMAADYGLTSVPLENVDAVLDSARDGGVSAVNGVVARERRITLGEWSGREVLIESPKVGLARCRLILAKGRLYTLMVAAQSKDLVVDPDSDRFLDSFSLADMSLPGITSARRPRTALDPAGSWTIAGTNSSDGSAYSGSVTFEKVGEAYRGTWTIGEQIMQGLGFLIDGHLMCGRGSDQGFGAAIYKINNNGTLDGRWVQPGAPEQVGTESAAGGPLDGLAGIYSVQGVNPGDASTYEGTLTIEISGELYRAAWNIATSQHTGVGIRVGDWLILAWGKDNAPMGVIEYDLLGENPQGAWGIPGATAIGGRETLTPAP
jgi:hypothetical protein